MSIIYRYTSVVEKILVKRSLDCLQFLSNIFNKFSRDKILLKKHTSLLSTFSAILFSREECVDLHAKRARYKCHVLRVSFDDWPLPF